MRRAAIVLLGWGTWLGVLTAVQAPFGPRAIEVEMLGSASAACLLAGAVLWLLEARAVRAREGGPAAAQALSDSSVASACVVCGLALALLGAGFGLWLILIGAGVAVLGAGGLAREAQARRRALRALRNRGAR